MGAKKGDPYALYAYGKSLYYGRGAKADAQVGLRLMLQAADLGHTYAMNELGYIFSNGVNVPPDMERGIRFYESGLKRDDIYSMNSLGMIYRAGKGVPQDLEKALELFKRAAEGGQPYAPRNIGLMYRDGLGVPKDEAAAITWLEMGAERGDYWSAFERAKMAKGDGSSPQSQVVAARYFAFASALNRPGTGDPKKQSDKELASIADSAKKKAAAAFSGELTPQELKTVPKTKSLNERLVFLAKATWVKRNPRYDLF
jgi:TPR repeat protein